MTDACNLTCPSPRVGGKSSTKHGHIDPVFQHALTYWPFLTLDSHPMTPNHNRFLTLSHQMTPFGIKRFFFVKFSFFFKIFVSVSKFVLCQNWSKFVYAHCLTLFLVFSLNDLLFWRKCLTKRPLVSSSCIFCLANLVPNGPSSMGFLSQMAPFCYILY